MQKKGFPGFTFCEFHSLPVSFYFSAFRELTPLDESNIWEFLLDLLAAHCMALVRARVLQHRQSA